MANNKIYIKRTATSGNKPTTAQIANGELAVNMTDGILYSTNGSVVFEIGANLTSVSVGNSSNKFTANTTQASLVGLALSANGGLGSAGQVLTSGGAGANVYWSTVSGGPGGSGSTYMKGGPSTVGTLSVEGQNIFRVNADVVNNDVTFASGENASATGPITVATGKTITIQPGARVSII